MQYTHIHFIGIGGIGMSGLAFLAAGRGIKVSGCDIDVDQNTISYIKNNGCTIYKNHGNKECFNTSIDLYVYSTRISQNSAEILYAKKHTVKIMHRAEFLALLLHDKIGIAITGTHGKTTTTSILAHILVHAKMDPSVMIGGMLPSIGGNARLGNHHTSLFVVEADESDRSLLQLPAPIKLITTIDYEHPETYCNLDDIHNTFKAFIEKEETKIIFACIDYENILKLIADTSLPVITYSTEIKTASIYPTEISLFSNESTFFVHSPYEKPFFITVPIPGLHNISNCLGAIGIALYLKVSYIQIQEALKEFQNPERRFSIRGKTKNGSIVIDDYAHHPAELATLIKTARHFAQKKLTLIFQPHKYQRTQALWDDFVAILGDERIDSLYITDIYPSGETPIERINSCELVQSIKKICSSKHIEYLPLNKIEATLLANNHEGDTLVFAGAGNIYQIGLNLINNLNILH